MKKLVKLFACILVSIITMVPMSHAGWSVDWEVSFTDTLDNLSDGFSIGVGAGLSDAYDITEDVLKVYPPGWPDSSYSGSVHPYIGMGTDLSGAELMKDARAAIVASTTTWFVEKKTNTNWIPLGQETISWAVSGTLPAQMNIKLEDWGTSNSSKIGQAEIVTNGAPSGTTSYQFTPSISGAGTYHYFRVVASEGTSLTSPVLEINYDAGTAQISVSWNSSSSERYNLYYSTDLQTWNEVPGQQQITGTDSLYTYSESSTGTGKKYYKCEVYLP
jgi:hypothetical protein